MSKKKIKRSPRSLGRKWALMYLYQSDIVETNFDESDFELFMDQIHKAPSPPNEFEADKGFTFARQLIQGVLTKRVELDEKITKEAENWKLERMATVDRNVLRLACYELMEVPSNHALIIVDEAIELAKAYGDNDSFRFVNGILHALATLLRSEEMEKKK